MVLTSVANTTLSVDLVAQDGAVVTLVLLADATYTFTFSSALEPTENEAGAYTVTGTDTFEFDPLVGEEAATMVITLRR